MTAWLHVDEDGYFRGGREYAQDREKDIPKGAIPLPDGCRIRDFIGKRLVAGEWVEEVAPGLEAENPKAVKAARKIEEAVQEARAYLASTDWLAVRLAETGKPIPSDIIAKRAKARETLSQV